MALTPEQALARYYENREKPKPEPEPISYSQLYAFYLAGLADKGEPTKNGEWYFFPEGEYALPYDYVIGASPSKPGSCPGAELLSVGSVGSVPAVPTLSELNQEA